MEKNPHNNDDDVKSLSQRLGEANVLPDTVLQPVSSTDLALLAIEKGAEEAEEKNR